MNQSIAQTTWKDLLRVALPALGLVILAAVFLLWARDLFGDDEPVGSAGTASPVAQIATVPPPTPTATAEVNLEATQAGGNSAGANGTPDDEPECDSDLAKADKVVVTEEEVRMRSEPDTTQDNVVETLTAGTELTIVGDCTVEDDEGNVFWQVRNEQTNNVGYVSAAFLDRAEDGE